MPLPSFTPTGTIYDIVGAESGELTAAALANARVVFTPNLEVTELITWEGEFYRLNPVVAVVDGLGTIGTDTRLLANDPGLNVDGLQWQVQVRIGISDFVMKPWWFDAPADGVTLDLADVARVPGVAAQGTAGLPEQVGHAGQFLTTDGSTASWTEVVGGGGGSGANLSVTRTSTAVTVVSDSGTDAVVAAADGSNAGAMTAAMQTKLAGIATGATANSDASINTLADARVAAGITGKLDTSAAPELIRDTIGTALVAGSNVTITPNDAGDTITVAATGGGGGGGDVTLTGAQTLTQKTIGDDLDFNAVSPPAAPSAGVRFYTRTGVSGLDAPAWVNNLGLPITIGRDIGIFAKNISGSTIAKGSAVYVASATAFQVNIAKAQADPGMTKLPCIGITAADITNNSFGMVLQFGVIQNLNTSGMSDGASVFVDPSTAGALTATRPTHPNPAQMIGVVSNSNSTTGSILVCATQYTSNRDQGVNGSTFGIGDGTGSAAKTLTFKNSNTGTLTWTPTAARTLTLPDVTGTVYASGGTDVPITDGGTGVSTLPTGLLKGAGTGAITAATSGTDYVVPSGSVATLTTPRTINGVSFNGSANIVITPLVNAMSFSATPTFDLAAYDVFQMAAVTAAITSATFTGGVNGKSYTFMFLANGAYALAFGANTRAIGVTIPSTVSGKYLYLTGKWNSTDAKLHWLGVAAEA